MGLSCIFRVDAAPFMGVGHLARCLALARCLSERGGRVAFVSRDFKGAAHAWIEQQGFELYRLPELPPPADPHDTSTWLACPAADDVQETLIVLRDADFRADWLIVDHYGIDASWESAARAAGLRVFVIDDLANRPHDCDLLLDQSLRASNPYLGLVPGSCITLLGPRYALLRDEFCKARASAPARDGSLRKVLVFFGGADLAGDTLKATDALAPLEGKLTADIIIGPLNVHREQIERTCARHPHLHAIYQVKDMAQRLAGADLAIGGGGTSCWERLAVGLPSMVIEQAANQAQNITALAELDVVVPLGRSADVQAAHLGEKLGALLDSPARLRDMATRAGSVVDARGAERVAFALMRPDVILRRATGADVDRVYQWRNSPEVRRFSGQSDVIALEAHRQWFHETLERPDRDLLIGEAGGQPIGVVRFDIDSTRALVSIYLTPMQLGHGWGAWLLRDAEQWLRTTRPEIQAIDARVLDANVTSRRMFDSLGYQRVQQIYSKHL